MKKRVHFYRLILEKSKQTNLFENDSITFSDKVIQLFRNHDETDLIQVNKNKIFTLITFDENHIFGTYGKVDDVELGSHMWGRNKEDYSLEDIQNLIESFTYFYLDMDNLSIALLHNYNLPDFRTPFANFLSSHFRISAIYDQISVESILSEEIPKSYGRKIPINKIKACFVGETIPRNEFIAVKEALNIANNEIEEATIAITMKPNTKKKFSSFKIKKGSFSELSFENDSENIDLIQNMITKKISIEVDDEDLRDDLKIKERLRSLLTDGL